MKEKLIFSWLLIMATQLTFGQQRFSINVTNRSNVELNAQPVTVNLQPNIKSAVVKLNGQEIPCQLDDLDGNGQFDELFFLTDLKGKEKQSFEIQLFDKGEPRNYEPQVYAEMLLSNKNVKESNKHDLYISSLTVDNGTNPYWQLHHQTCGLPNLFRPPPDS